MVLWLHPTWSEMTRCMILVFMCTDTWFWPPHNLSWTKSHMLLGGTCVLLLSPSEMLWDHHGRRGQMHLWPWLMAWALFSIPLWLALSGARRTSSLHPQGAPGPTSELGCLIDLTSPQGKGNWLKCLHRPEHTWSQQCSWTQLLSFAPSRHPDTLFSRAASPFSSRDAEQALPVYLCDSMRFLLSSSLSSWCLASDIHWA